MKSQNNFRRNVKYGHLISVSLRLIVNKKSDAKGIYSPFKGSREIILSV